MSFTFNILDQRRTGLKIGFIIPRKRFVEPGAAAEWSSPFKWSTDAEKGQVRPEFLTTSEELEKLDAELSLKRLAALKELSGKSRDGLDILKEYYKHITLMQKTAAAARPSDEINTSLSNHEQDRLLDERARHLIFESNLEIERIKLLYNMALYTLQAANKFRFVFKSPAFAMLQEAAGMFDLLANTPLPEGLPNEISPDYLRILALCSLAALAEKAVLERQVAPRSQWEACTHLCYSIHHYYAQITSLIKHAKATMDRAAGVPTLNNLLNFSAVKQDFYRALAFEFHSMQPDTRRHTSRLRKALRGYEAAFAQLSKQLPGIRNNVEKEITFRITRTRGKLVETNDEGQVTVPEEAPLESKRYAGMVQQPTFHPKIPEWLHEEAKALLLDVNYDQESVLEGSESPDAASTRSLPKPNRLQLTLTVPDEDLFHKELEQKVDMSGNSLPSYHQVDMLAGVTLTELEPARPGFTMVLLFDAWSPTEGSKNKIATVREIATLLLKVVGLTELDKIGIVGWVNNTLKSFPLVPADKAGLELLIQQINSLRPVGNHKGSSGSSIVEALIESMKRLRDAVDSTSYEVVVFSDGFDSTSETKYKNWMNFNELLNQHKETEECLRRFVRVHTFALGGECDKYLLKAVSSRFRGDYSTADQSQEGLSYLRSWFLRHIADQRSKVATNCKLTVTCRPGVTLRQIGSYDLVFDPTYTHQHSSDPSMGEILLDDFSEGHSSNVVITLGVPETNVQYVDKTYLADVEISFVDAFTGAMCSDVQTVELNMSNSNISRELHGWLPQLYTTATEGSVYVSGAGGGTVPLLGGDLVDPRDSVDVKAGMCRAMTSDNTQYVLCERTVMVVNSIDGEAMRASVTLRKGSMFVATGQQAELDIHVIEPMHVVTVEAHSHVKVGIDPVSGLVSVNCMDGHTYVTTTRKEEESVMELLSLMQTQMSDKVGPITPWTLEESSYSEWFEDKVMASYLSAMLHIGIHVSRTVCAQWIGAAAEWLRKGSWDRVRESQGNRRCREFLTRFWLRESKHFLTNNISGLAIETEHVRKYVDKTINIALGPDKSKRRNETWLFHLLTVSQALFSERAKGNIDSYDTPLQKRLHTECADAKAKEEKDREEAEQNRQRQLRDSEASRRENVLAAVFPLSDMDGVGAVHFTAIQQTISAFEDVKDAALQDIINLVTEKWKVISSALQKAKTRREVGNYGAKHDMTGGLSLNEKDFIRLWLKLTGDCDTPSFNLLLEQLHGIVEELFMLNEGTRKSRAVFSLFRKWDNEGIGHLLYGEVVDVLRAVHGGEPYFVQSIELMNKGVQKRPPAPVRTNSSGLGHFKNMNRTTSSMSKTRSMPISPCGSEQCRMSEDDISASGNDHATDFRLTLRRFHYAIAAFYFKFTERAFHNSVEKLLRVVQTMQKAHNTVASVVKSLQREQQQEHLQQWDLRHVFDGITSKLAKISVKDAPEYVQAVSAPICILCGIVTKKGVWCTEDKTLPPPQTLNSEESDFWSVLRDKLIRDADGFIDFLRNFPVLSITYRQVLRVMKYLDSPDFDSCRLLSLSPPLSHLCDWVKLILKIAFLEQGWDFSNSLEVLNRPRGGEKGEEFQVIQEPNNKNNNCNVVQKPHTALKLNRSFEGIIEADDPGVRVSSRFSMYSQADSKQLPDRRLNTPLLRTMPVGSVSVSRLPPHFVPRLDYHHREDVVCTELHSRAYQQSRLGRYGDQDTPVLLNKGPPRPSSAPLAGTTKRQASRRGTVRSGRSSIAFTPTPPHSALPVHSTEVSRWLEFNGLEELVGVMHQQGFDDLTDLKELATNESTMSLFVPKPGSRMKLKRLLEV